MAQGPTVYTALIMPLSAASPPDRPGGQPPQPGQPPSGGGGRPDNTLPGNLPRPEHPIWYPLPPGAPVDPDYGIPGYRPDQRPPTDERPDQGLPGGGRPPGRPDQGLPPSGVGPDQGLPGAQPGPEHPIALPPGGEGGWLPAYIWGGGNVPMPNPPIELPGEGEPPDPDATVKWHAMWTPTTGWVSIAVVVPPQDGGGSEGGSRPTPSPSKRGR